MVSQWGIDNVATASDLDLLLLISAAMSILLASQVLMSAARSWFLTRLTNEFVLRWKLDVFSRLVSLPVNYFYSQDGRHNIAIRFYRTNCEYPE